MTALLIVGQAIFAFGMSIYAYHKGRYDGLNRRMALHYEAFPDCPGRPFHNDATPEAPW